MLVFWQAKLVLLAVPKTGTTALETALQSHASAAILSPPAQKHTPARRYKRQLAPFFEENGRRSLETVALVREPVAWLSSWYRYRRRDALIGHPNSTLDLSFDQFIAAWLQDKPPQYARVGRQSRFVSGSDGNRLVDHLFAYENMKQAIAFLENRIGVVITPPHVNVSPVEDVNLSTEMRRRLEQQAQEEFALWSSISTG